MNKTKGKLSIAFYPLRFKQEGLAQSTGKSFLFYYKKPVGRGWLLIKTFPDFTLGAKFIAITALPLVSETIV